MSSSFRGSLLVCLFGWVFIWFVSIIEDILSFAFSPVLSQHENSCPTTDVDNCQSLERARNELQKK